MKASPARDDSIPTVISQQRWLHCCIRTNLSDSPSLGIELTKSSPLLRWTNNPWLRCFLSAVIAGLLSDSCINRGWLRVDTNKSAPVIASNPGRIVDCLITASGSRVPSRDSDGLMKTVMEIDATLYHPGSDLSLDGFLTVA